MTDKLFVMDGEFTFTLDHGAEYERVEGTGPTTKYENLLTDAQRSGEEIERREDDWVKKGICYNLGMKVFFDLGTFEPKAEKKERERRAKAICALCVVQVQCLQFAIENHESGNIWGGLNEAERRKVAGLPPIRSGKSA